MRSKVLKALETPKSVKELCKELNRPKHQIAPIVSKLFKTRIIKIHDIYSNEGVTPAYRYIITEIRVEEILNGKLDLYMPVFYPSAIILKHQQDIINKQKQLIYELYTKHYKLNKIMSATILDLINPKTKIKWTSYLAVGVAEGFENIEWSEDSGLSEDIFYNAIKVECWAVIIKHKVYKGLQGWFGRNCQVLIDNGLINEDGFINWENFMEDEEEFIS
jgi:hypothetical protein